MKQGTAINKIVMLLFFLAILLYLGGAAWKGLRDPYPTVQAYAYEVDDTVEATGWLVRQEEVFSGTGGIIRLIPSEGEKVAAGTTVALLYADEGALERSERLESLRAEEAQLSAAIQAAETEGGPGENAGQAVADALVSLRASVEAGDFTGLESQSAALKSAIYRQAQRSGDAGILSGTLAGVRSEIEALRAQTVESVGRVQAAKSGVFSGQTDGYESILTPAALETLTPSDLDALADKPVSEGSGLGKLITSSTWRFVCPLTAAEAKRLAIGEKITVRFSRDWSGEVDMTVERMVREESGRVAVVLSSTRFLSETTLLRRQTVELIFSQQRGIRVPTRAIRVEVETAADPETGAEIQKQVTCVYARVGTFAERKPVTVLAQGEDFTLVEPLLSEEATATQRKKALRAGDQIIIASGEIWDGKVLE